MHVATKAGTLGAPGIMGSPNYSPSPDSAPRAARLSPRNAAPLVDQKLIQSQAAGKLDVLAINLKGAPVSIVLAGKRMQLKSRSHPSL